MPEKCPIPHECARPTAPFYSFEDPQINRTDTYISGEVMSTRILSYTVAKREKTAIRDDMKEKGLVIGRQLDQMEPRTVDFLIPASLKPLEHSKSVNETSEFVYNDEALFYDLGRLLTTLAGKGDEPSELCGQIGHSVSMIEYTKRNQSRLQFVPGFEHYVYPAQSGREDLKNVYVLTLMDEFGPRFEPHIDAFVEGMGE